MSAFKDDQSREAQKHMIGDIRRAIECGDTCFLMYTEPIHGSLYDLFNQFFTVQRDRDQNAKLYVQIGIGSYSKVSPSLTVVSVFHLVGDTVSTHVWQDCLSEQKQLDCIIYVCLAFDHSVCATRCAVD